MAFRVISLMGGGIKGVVETIILQRLLVSHPQLLDEVDLIAGTSTGGIIALALAAGVPLDRIRYFYEHSGASIFRFYQGFPTQIGLFCPKYSNAGLKTCLAELFSTRRLGTLTKNVCVPAFDLDNQGASSIGERCWKVKVFHNLPGEKSDEDELAFDVAMATCAAPTYFPAYNGYIDGGVALNDPALAAVALTQDRRLQWIPPALDEVIVLSVGSGVSRKWVECGDLEWGKAQWGTRVFDLLFDGLLDIPDYQCRQFLGQNYHRIMPVFPVGMNVDLDGWQHIEQLVRFAETVDLTLTEQWLKIVGWGGTQRA